MKSIYAGASKIPNASGRSDYISNPNRQEHLVLTNSMMEYSWKQHSVFEKAHRKTNKANNEALEVQINLPNELKDDLVAIKKICDELAARIVGEGHDMEYGVHWNKSKQSLHCHLLFSERENQTELNPKIYKRDIWYNYKTQRIAKAGSPGAELIHRKGEVQRDADGNIKYDGDLFTAKDTQYKTTRWIYQKNEIVQAVLKEHGFDFEIHTKDGPFMPQKKLTKGASEDYLAAARAWNDAVNEYNAVVRAILKEQPDAEPQLCAKKKQLVTETKAVNRLEKRITTKAIELIRDAAAAIKELFLDEKKEIKVTVPSDSIAGANGIYVLNLRDGFVFLWPHELRHSENGVEITLDKDAIYNLNSNDAAERYTGEELNDIIQAEQMMARTCIVDASRIRWLDDETIAVSGRTFEVDMKAEEMDLIGGGVAKLTFAQSSYYVATHDTYERRPVHEVVNKVTEECAPQRQWQRQMDDDFEL